MEQEKKSKSRIWIVIGAIVGVGVMIIIQQVYSRVSSIDGQLKIAAKAINMTCPVAIDSETRLDSVTTKPGRIFSYYYTITSSELSEVDAGQLENYMEPVIVNAAKENKDLEDFRKNKVTLVYNYNDKNGLFIFAVNVTPEKYLTAPDSTSVVK